MLVTGEEQWVYHDVGYRHNGYAMALVTGIHIRNNGHVMTLVTGQGQWAYQDVDYRAGTMTSKKIVSMFGRGFLLVLTNAS